MSISASIKRFLKELFKELFLTRVFNHVQLAQYLDQLYAKNIKASCSGLPDKILFPREFWTQVKDLYEKTRAHNIEYASSVYVIDGDVIFTPPIKGQASHVQIRHKIRWKYRPLGNNRYEKIVFVDDKQVFKKILPAEKVPRHLRSTYLFSVHTHPWHQGFGYSYFSHQDMKSLVHGRALAIGLITDKLHLVFKTQKSPNTWTMPSKKLITPKLLQQLGFCLYTAEFSKELEKMPYDPETT